MTPVLRPEPGIVFRPSVKQYRVLMELVRDGADNETIARRLGCDYETVKSHIKALLAKTGLANRTELALAVAYGHLVPKVPAGGE